MRAALALALLALLALGPGASTRGDDLAARAARSYTLVPRVPAALAPGGRGAVGVTIRCDAGVHVQRQAPLRAAVSASPGLEVERRRLGWEDARGTPDAPELEVAVVASGPGAAEVRLRLDFFVCSKEWCVRQERELVVPVEVAGPTAPAPPR